MALGPNLDAPLTEFCNTVSILCTKVSWPVIHPPNFLPVEPARARLTTLDDAKALFRTTCFCHRLSALVICSILTNAVIAAAHFDLRQTPHLLEKSRPSPHFDTPPTTTSCRMHRATYLEHVCPCRVSEGFQPGLQVPAWIFSIGFGINTHRQGAISAGFGQNTQYGFTIRNPHYIQ